ncbi:uncharacterized protein VP01_2515g1 [Puccinia sorghi]|uniref:Uncharacterized protein n=1 Tax=Puccinia sorghi TaxID=27349 RepID=A0A0L6V5N5_9BASI|nr:uncharacterized protein VP01_2515g1 [Puccinia sorghi]
MLCYKKIEEKQLVSKAYLRARGKTPQCIFQAVSLCARDLRSPPSDRFRRAGDWRFVPDLRFGGAGVEPDCQAHAKEFPRTKDLPNDDNYEEPRVGCWLAEPSSQEQWRQFIDWSHPELNEAILPSTASSSMADHHWLWLKNYDHGRILTAIPDHPLQPDSHTDPTGMGATLCDWVNAVDDCLNQPHEEITLSEYNPPPSLGASQISDGFHHTLGSSFTNPAFASWYPAWPSMTTTTTTNQSKRKSPPRIHLPPGPLIHTQLSASHLRPIWIPVPSDIQYDHCQPYLDSASKPPSQGPTRRRKIQLQNALGEPTDSLGSVQGREMLPTEPPEKLQSQALMKFDASLFQLVRFSDDTSEELHVQQKDIDLIRGVINLFPSKLLIIPERKFLHFYQFYELRHRESKDRPSRQGMPTNVAYSNRRGRLTKQLKEFSRHAKFWYDRWFAITRTNFIINPHVAHYAFLSLYRCVTIHSLYLLYVEIIFWIVPREAKSVTLAIELKLAHEAFERLSKAAQKRAASKDAMDSFNDTAEKTRDEEADRLLNHLAEKLKGQDAGRGIFGTFHRLWIYLEFWMDTNRPGIFKALILTKNLSSRFKSFFMDLFFYSYTALHQRCLSQQATLVTS